jgi:FkbM family methyltransferase
MKNYQNWWSIFYSRITSKVQKTVQLGSGEQFQGDSLSLVFEVVDEVFCKQIYKYEPVSIQKGDVVIDIGANIGVFSVYAVKCGAKHVHAYEPNPANVKLIKNNLKLNAIADLVTVHSVAVSGEVGSTRLYLAHLNVGHTLFDHNIKGRLDKFIKVNTVSLAHIINSNKLDRVDFLKLDCEGSEGDILLSTPKSVWSKIGKIAIEYHNNVSKLKHKEICQYLEKFGYHTTISEQGTDFGFIYAWRM